MKNISKLKINNGCGGSKKGTKCEQIYTPTLGETLGKIHAKKIAK